MSDADFRIRAEFGSLANKVMMTSDWQTIRIGEIAKPIERAEVPMAGAAYRQIGVRLWGQGAYECETIDGSQTKYVTLSRVECFLQILHDLLSVVKVQNLHDVLSVKTARSTVGSQAEYFR